MPATVTDALRLAPLFDATDTVAAPDPLPLPLADVHEDADEEVQLQPAVVVTLTVAEPDPYWKPRVDGDTL